MTCFAHTPLLVCSFQFRDALRVGNIFLSNEFFSVLLDERDALKQMRDELCRFAIVTEPAKTTFGKVIQRPGFVAASNTRMLTLERYRAQVRKTYTGKIGGLNDDLAITLQLAITGLRCFYQVCATATPAPCAFSRRVRCVHCVQSDKYTNFRPSVY